MTQGSDQADFCREMHLHLRYSCDIIMINLLITHRYKLADIEEAYRLFENKLDGVIKVAVEP